MKPNCTILDNGMYIVTDNLPTVESVSIKVLIEVGARDEENSKDGISHCIEHMNFKGTEKRSAKKIAEEFDMIGGYLNAYTSRERTVYCAKVLKDDLGTSIDILADIIQNSTYDSNELQLEKKVILQEIAENNDTPEELIFDLLQEKAFPEQQVGKSILGTVESVQSITSVDIREYVAEHYNYINTVIGVSGNINEDEVVNLISNKFNNLAINNKTLSNERTKIQLTNSSPNYVGGEVKLVRDLEQIHLLIGFEGVSYYHNDYYDFQIASMVAGGGMSSRLFQEIREKRGLAYSISAFASSYSDFGMWQIYAATSEAEIRELISVIVEQMQELANNVTEEELIRAKAQIKSSLLMSQESTGSRAEKIINNYSVFKRFISMEEILEKIEAVDTNSIQKTISHILSNAKLVKPTVAAIGNVNFSPYEELIKNI